MAFKLIFQLCVSVFVVKAVVSQCIPSLGLQTPWACAPHAVAPKCGIPMVIPAAPIEVSISSDDLLIDGCINVFGRLPFHGGVLVDGAIPNCGGASVYYECGDGHVGVESGLAGAGLGYNPGLGYNEFAYGRY